MYGYIVPDKTTLRASDFVLYRSFYCGICCHTGKVYGQLPRFTTNYDFAFLSALLHDYSKSDIVIEEHKCVLNPIKKKAVLQSNPLLDKLVAANILLSYAKAEDGVIDGDGMKYRVVRKVLKKPYRTAKKLSPELWNEIESYSALQDKVEKNVEKSVDRAADPFASLLKKLPSLILCGQTDDNIEGLCYNIGKFVYLADALDDITDDFKDKRYNPFLAHYGAENFGKREKFIADNLEELTFIFQSVCARAGECLGRLRLTQSRSLLENIVFDGMRKKTDELLASKSKLKPPRI